MSRQARDLVEAQYTPLKAPVLRAVRRQLAVRHVELAAADLEDFYNLAWERLLQRLSDGQPVTTVPGYLVRVTFCRAVDEWRKLHPAERADPAALAARPDGRQLEAQVDDAAKLRHFMEAMRERLQGRERVLVELLYLQGLSRREAARRMRLEERRVHKIMDGTQGRPGVTKKVATFVGEIAAGGWCASRKSLLTAYAHGVLSLDGERVRLATSHLGACPGCRAYVRSLRADRAVVAREAA